MAGQQTVTVKPAAYTSLGTGPWLIEALNNPIRIAIADTPPAAGSAGIIIYPDQPVAINATTTVWASTTAETATLTYGQITTSGGSGSGGTSSNFSSAFPSAGTAVGAEYLSNPPSLTSGQMVALQTDSSGNLKVNVAAGDASGGTSSSFAAAFPSTGTAIGAKNGSNMVNLTADLSGNLNVDLQTALPPGSNAIGTVGVTSLPALPAGSNAIGSVSVSNFPATQAVSASSLPLPTGAAQDSSINGILVAQGSSTSGGKGPLIQGAVTTGSPSYTSGQTSPLSLDTSGSLRVNVVSGGVAGYSQGSTTSGQVGGLTQAAVTSSAPSYTTGQTSPLSLTTSGALRVDGSAVTQPVSGTVTANAGTGTFAHNLTQVNGSAVSTAASGVQKVGITGNAGAAVDAAGQNASSPANEIIVGGQFNTTPTTITSGNVSPLQLDSSGNLKVNVAAGSASGGTSSNFSASFPSAGTAIGAEYLSSPPTLTSGQMVALQTDVNGNLKVNIASGGGSGGTSSSFGASFPSTGTAAGLEYLSSPPTLTSGNMGALQGDVNGNLKVNLQSALPAGSNAIGSVSVSNFPATQAVSASSLPLPSGAAQDSSVNGILVAQGSTTSGEKGPLIQGAVTSSAPSYTTAQTSPLSLNTSGGLRVDGSGVTQPVSGTVTANAGTNLNTSALALESGGNLASIASTSLSQGSTTSGQKGYLELAAVTTSAPSYTTGQSSLLSLDTSGNLRVNGSGVTQPVSGTVTANAGTGTFAHNLTQVNGSTVSTAATGVQKVGITGNSGAAVDAAGQNASSPANEIIVGGQFSTTPTTITSGNVSPLQLDSSGNLKVNIAAGSSSGGTSSSFSASFPSTGTAIGAEYSSSAPTLTSGQMVALQTDVNGNLKVNIVAGGGTSSSLGSSFPSTGTAVGLEYLSSAPTLTSGNMGAFQGDVNGNLKINLQTALPSGSNGIGTVGVTSLPSIPAGSNNIGAVTANAGTGNFAVNVAQVNGSTVSTAATGVQKVGITGNAGAAVDAAAQNASSPANEIIVGGQFNTTRTTITSGNVSPLQLDSSGNLKVNIAAGSSSGGTSSSRLYAPL
jgi:hypothetical protein